MSQCGRIVVGGGNIRDFAFVLVPAQKPAMGWDLKGNEVSRQECLRWIAVGADVAVCCRYGL